MPDHNESRGLLNSSRGRFSLEILLEQRKLIDAELRDGQRKGCWRWELASAPAFPRTDVAKFLSENPNFIW